MAVNWKAHTGQQCPVEQGVRVDVKILNTITLLNLNSGILSWNKNITHYRIPTQKK